MEPIRGEDTVQEIRSNAYWITFNRPDQLNAMTPRMMTEMKSGILQASGDPEIGAIVLKGNGRSFTSGADLRGLFEIVDEPSKLYAEFHESYGAAAPYPTMLSCPKPIVAVIDGLCLAAGLVIASCSDIVLASNRSKFGVPQGRVGLCDPFDPGLASTRHWQHAGEVSNGCRGADNCGSST